MAKWRVESFEFETEPSPISARGTNEDGFTVREHDGRMEFWTGKTWLFLPGHANVYKLPKFTDGYYLDRTSGLVLRRMNTEWYYWSTHHDEWKWFDGTNDDNLSESDLKRMGNLNG